MIFALPDVSVLMSVLVNKNKNFCYRITHIHNLPLILKKGLVCKKYAKATDEQYINIGNNEIIDVRSMTPVKINGYGNLGDYVPFYFTPRSMMLYNIVTGFREPVVPKRSREDILVVRCLIDELSKLDKWFFTDGQANDKDTARHFNNLKHLDKIDWECIQRSDFTKSDGDYDRPRRYQAEFLVHKKVPLEAIESLNVYNQAAADYVNGILAEHEMEIVVNITRSYFF